MELGQLIGRFRISKHVGKGGMGNVYLALDTVNFRQVAVKVLPRVFQTSTMLIARFLREMEVCRRLSHPNIVGFVDASLDHDQYYLVQEYILGSSLEELIAKAGGMLAKDLALSIMQDASYALHAVHQQKIIHRDIKPQNIMVTKENAIKLIDFGIAQVRDEKIHQGILAELDRVGLRYRTSDLKTQPGTVIGTPCYNSPEQNQAKEISPSSDIYSLGLVFYEMFTGVQVLPNTTLTKIIDFQSELDDHMIPISQVNPDIPKSLDVVIAGMIRYRPEERFQSASELVLAIKKLGVGFSVGKDSSDQNSQSKRLARLELFETYYWKAMNLLGEHQYLEALTEFESLINLHLGEGKYKRPIEEISNYLLWVLKPSVAAGAIAAKGRSKGYRVPLEDYISCLMKIITIFSKIGLDGHKELAERKFVKTVEEIEEYDRALEFYDKIFAVCPQDLVIKRGYASFLYANGAISAGRCAHFDIVKQCYADRNFEAARDELKKVLQYEEDNTQVKEELAQLADLLARRTAEKETFLKKLDALKGTKELEFFLSAYEKFQEKYPGNPDVMERLLNVYIDLNQEAKTTELLCRLGADQFEKDPSAAKERFIKALLIDSKCSLAMSYLVELLKEQGISFNDCDNYREAIIKLFTSVGFHKEAILELEKRLSGSISDLETYDRMINLYKRSGHTAKIHEIYFEMGKCALVNNRPDLARDFFDEAIDQAKDRDSLYDRLRTVPNINKVYDLMKLVYSKRLSKDGGASDEQRNKARDGQLTTWIQKIRGG